MNDFIPEKAKEDELISLKQSQERVQLEANQARSQLSEIRHKLADADNERADLLRGNKDLENQLTQAKRSNRSKEEGHQEALQAQRRKLAELEASHAQTNAKIQSLQDENSTLKVHAEKLRRELTDHNTKLTAKRDADSRKLVECEDELAQLQAEKTDLVSKLKGSQRRLVDLENEIIEVRSENDSLAQKVDNLKSNDKKASDDLRRAEADSKKLISSLKVEKRAVEEEIELVRINLDQKSDECDQLQAGCKMSF